MMQTDTGRVYLPSLQCRYTPPKTISTTRNQITMQESSLLQDAYGGYPNENRENQTKGEHECPFENPPSGWRWEGWALYLYDTPDSNSFNHS